MTDPDRAERLWLAIAIATWWRWSIGGEAETAIPTATFLTVPGSPRRPGCHWRLVGIFRHGWSLILAVIFNHQPLLIGHGCQEPWLGGLLIPTDGLSLPTLQGETIEKPTCKGWGRR